MEKYEQQDTESVKHSDVSKEESDINCNVKDKTIFCKDNLEILRGINSNSINLIYLDPPLNTKKQITAPIGSKAEGVSFNDYFDECDVKEEWLEILEEKEPKVFSFLKLFKEFKLQKENWAYFCYMAIRLVEMRRVLKDTGSIYLHCDSTISHYLKCLMDGIFGIENFKNDIVWAYKRPTNNNINLGRVNDRILFYGKSKDVVFNQIRVPFPDGTFGMRKSYTKPDGTIWEAKANGKALADCWDDIPNNSMSKEKTGYPSQKPLKLLERIIKVSSNGGDIILDPFCGSGTTLIAAEKLGRKWIGIDSSKLANELVIIRCRNEIGTEIKSISRDDILIRTDNEGEIKTVEQKQELRTLLYAKQEGYCNICKAHFNLWNMNIDRIFPGNKGGKYTLNNVQLLCNACNSMKEGNKNGRN